MEDPWDFTGLILLPGRGWYFMYEYTTNMGNHDEFPQCPIALRAQWGHEAAPSGRRLNAVEVAGWVGCAALELRLCCRISQKHNQGDIVQCGRLVHERLQVVDQPVFDLFGITP